MCNRDLGYPKSELSNPSQTSFGPIENLPKPSTANYCPSEEAPIAWFVRDDLADALTLVAFFFFAGSTFGGCGADKEGLAARYFMKSKLVTSVTTATDVR